MLWIVFWGLLAALGALGTAAALSGRRFSRQVAREARALLAQASPARPPALEQLAQLPPPVRRYLEQALGASPRAIASVRFRHGGRFRTRLDGAWELIQGEQYDTLDPPGFLWWGRLSLAPGLWIDAVDRGVGGKGRMTVTLESSWTLFDRSGPELDQGAMLRLLSDFVLFPSILLDPRYVTWQALDAQHARATLRAPGSGESVTGTFEFGHEGLPISFHSDRYLDSGRGPPRLLPWSGEYEDYRSVNGLLVPHHFIGYWHLDGQRIPYVDFSLETPEYDEREPF